MMLRTTCPLSISRINTSVTTGNWFNCHAILPLLLYEAESICALLSVSHATWSTLECVPGR